MEKYTDFGKTLNSFIDSILPCYSNMEVEVFIECDDLFDNPFQAGPKIPISSNQYKNYSKWIISRTEPKEFNDKTKKIELYLTNPK